LARILIGRSVTRSLAPQEALPVALVRSYAYNVRVHDNRDTRTTNHTECLSSGARRARYILPYRAVVDYEEPSAPRAGSYIRVTR